MIHELRTYTLMPGKQGEYLKLNEQVGRKVRGDKYGKLEGSWTTEFGMLNQYVHLWAYPDWSSASACGASSRRTRRGARTTSSGSGRCSSPRRTRSCRRSCR